ncbi:hypothetical protein GTA51_17650 [Desulfovibrio aerotolerans]|uniref:Uncharacterized protein n=1 Tax=Solidesulfovibrio aerotolerans TaxID=295255 RepID=A0A7C9IVJ9_9BACT|nr:hypothetical protein [Solidesulfovibrio aerotolerans]MYL84940.1 hypothetical protein [Solidesulfovibrio aerotolerans]
MLFFEGRELSLDIFKDMLDKYLRELMFALERDPFKSIFLGLEELKAKHKRSKSLRGVPIRIKFAYYVPDDLGKTSHHYLSNTARIINEVVNEINIYLDLIEKNKKLNSIFRENLNQYIILRSKIRLINNFKKSKECDRIQAVIKCVSSLFRFDFIHIIMFCDSDAYKLCITKELGQSTASAYQSIRKNVLNKAANEAYYKWRKGSKLLHHKMAAELSPFLNTIFRKKLLEQLELSYEQKSGYYKCKKRYLKRKEEIIAGKSDLSLQLIKEAIKKVAKRFKMYFDPGAKHRTSK